MISLVEFLFLEDIDPLQAESILDSMPNMQFKGVSEFYDYFKSKSIVLKKVSKNQAGSTLLERLKSFKQSYEYEVVRNFIEEQNKIQKLLSTNPTNITVIENQLESISKYNLDTFDYYIVRKLLDPNGSSNGILPSEQLKTLMESLLAKKSELTLNELGSINFDKDLRDPFDRAITYQNLYKNNGRYRLPILDERFYYKDFDYVVDRNFESLPDAVSAEINLLGKLANVTDIDAFLTDLGKITIENESSITGLNAKIQRLEEIIDIKQQEVQSYVDAQIEHEAFIDSIASDNLQKDDEILQKNETINQLNETIATTLSQLEANVANQINGINAALDALSQNVSSQGASKNSAQDAEIAALKSQIAALQSTINSLRSSTSGGTSGGGSTLGPTGRLNVTGSASTVGRNNPAGAGRPGL